MDGHLNKQCYIFGPVFPQKGFPGKSRKSDESKRHHPMLRNWINLYTKFRHHPMVRNWINLYTKFRHHPMLRNGINLYTKFRHHPMLRNWINLYTKFHLKQTILIFWTKFAPSMKYKSEHQHLLPHTAFAPLISDQGASWISLATENKLYKAPKKT